MYHVMMNSASASQERQLPRPVQWAAILFALCFPSAFTYVYFFAAAGDHPNLQHLAYTVGKTIQFAFPAIWILAIEHRRVKLPTPTTSGLGIGLALGAAIGASMLAAYFLWLAPAGDLADIAPKVREKLSEFQIDTPGKLIAMGLFYSLLHSLLEEYYWRWFAFGRLRSLMSVRAAIAISSVGFMGHHAIVLWKYLPLAVGDLGVGSGRSRRGDVGLDLQSERIDLRALVEPFAGRRGPVYDRLRHGHRRSLNGLSILSLLRSMGQARSLVKFGHRGTA